jgi:hypothetical protein
VLLSPLYRYELDIRQLSCDSAWKEPKVTFAPDSSHYVPLAAVSLSR